MARLPNTVMNMAPAISEYRAARTPSGLSFSGQDPLPFQSNSKFSSEKTRTHEILSVNRQNIVSYIYFHRKIQKRHRRLKEDNLC